MAPRKAGGTLQRKKNNCSPTGHWYGPVLPQHKSNADNRCSSVDNGCKQRWQWLQQTACVCNQSSNGVCSGIIAGRNGCGTTGGKCLPTSGGAARLLTVLRSGDGRFLGSSDRLYCSNLGYACAQPTGGRARKAHVPRSTYCYHSRHSRHGWKKK